MQKNKKKLLKLNKKVIIKWTKQLNKLAKINKQKRQLEADLFNIH